ncbi:hypothetical protein [Runella sp.]|uniref:helix-turn-helix transcriptional regulator n=1 Tax=Runella sp. TaxID=1960881 RepID=UPI003D0F5DB9
MVLKISFSAFIFFFLGFIGAFSQSETEDSIAFFKNRLATQTKLAERAQSLSKLSWFYSTKGDSQKAMQAAFEAISLFEKGKDYEGIRLTYNTLAQVFQFQHNEAKTTYYTKKALEYALLSKNPSVITTATMNYAVSLSDEKKFDESLKIFGDALAIAIKNKDTLNILGIQLNIASTLYDKGDAVGILKPAAAGLELAKKTGNTEATLRGEAIVGAALIRQKKFEEADEHFKRAEALLPEVGSAYYDRQMAFIRTEWAAMQGKYKEAFGFQQKFYELDTLMANTENKQKVAELETKLRTNEKELENATLQSKLTQQKWLLAGGLVLLGLLILIFYLQRKSLVQKNNLLQTQHKLSETELTLVQNQLESFANIVSEKNKLIGQFENEIKDLRLKDEASGHVLLEQINQARIITDDQWQDFRLKFEKLHPQFITRLHQRNASLTDTETQMACMIRLNFSNSQIAGMLGISNESVIKSKYRLRKKIDQTDLNSYVSDI